MATKKAAAAATSDAPAGAPSEAPALVHVYPHPDLATRGEYLAGVGIDGADVPAELAAEWQAAGLATTSKPAVAED